jgi:hypothetical protein
MNRSKHAGMGKKTIVVLLVGLALVSVRLAEAQPAKEVPRIGYLDPASSEASLRQIEALRKGLTELGYLEGKTSSSSTGMPMESVIDFSPLPLSLSSARLMSLLPALHLVLKPRRMRPIEFPLSSLPLVIRLGADSSRASPDQAETFTGLTIFSPELGGKRLELLKEAFPKIRRVAFFWSTMNPGFSFAEAEAAGKPLSVEVQSVQIRDVEDIESAFEKVRKIGSQAFTTAPDPVMRLNLRRLLDFAAKNRLPAMYGSISCRLVA